MVCLYMLSLVCSALMAHVVGPRALGVQLFYTDDCPEGYKAHSFADIDSDVDSQNLLFPVHELWTRVSELCGVVNSGFHTSVSSALQWTVQC